jgi:hypothetical protein
VKGEEEEEKEVKKKTAIIKAKQTHKSTPSISEGPPSAKRKCGL